MQQTQKDRLKLAAAPDGSVLDWFVELLLHYSSPRGLGY